MASRALQQARQGRGRGLIVEGPPGIGKTRILAAATALASGWGCRVLSARGGELERDFPYGVARQLFEGPLRRMAPSRRASVLDGSAALGGAVLGFEAGRLPPAATERRRAILHGLYWLVSNLAEEAPVLLVVDDAHWGDDASLAFLYYLARRIEELPVCLMLARRVGEDNPGGILARVAAEPSTEILEPAPLSEAGVCAIVRDSVGAEADAEFCRACWSATGGNPFLLHGVLVEVRAQAISPTAAEAARIERLAPEAVARSVLARLARLPSPATHLARAVAVLAGSAEPRLSARLAGLGRTEAAGAADALAAAEILTTDRPLRFVHPVVRQAVYYDIPPGERSIAHATAARLLLDDGAAAGQAASHLLHSDPAGDAAAVELLRRAAADAVSSGAPRTAISYLRRALAEPPPQEHRLRVLTELGHALGRVGDPEALGVLSRALGLGADSRSRVEVALELARAREQSGDQKGGFEVLQGVDTADLPPDVGFRVDAERIAMSIHSPSRAKALRRLRELRPHAEHSRPGSAVLLATAALVALEEGQPAETAAGLARDAVGIGLLDAGRFPFVYAAATLIWAECFDEAGRAWNLAVEEGRRRGAAFLFAAGSTWRAHLRYRLGQLHDAEADGRAALDVVDELDWEILLAYSGAFLADVLIEQGEMEEAGVLLDRSTAAAQGRHGLFHLDSRGRLDALQGRFSEAAACFEAVGRGQEGFRSPGIIPWRSNLALTLARLGERREALPLAREELDLAQVQGGNRTVGVALRALGIIEGGRAGVERLRAAVAALEQSPAVLEHARALADLGTALRRARAPTEAREPLRRALELANRCGASALADHVHDELLATGARPRRPAMTGVAALTASERRVARLAAEGLSNREIAQSLFLSMRTVATHLSNAYRKLGIERRGELPRALTSRLRTGAVAGDAATGASQRQRDAAI